MKKYPKISVKAFFNKYLLLAIFCSLFTGNALFADAADSSSDEKPQANIDMQYYKENGVKKIKIKATDDNDDPIPFLVVNIYLNENSKFGMMGNINTDENGEGEFLLNSKRFEYKADSVTKATGKSEYHFIASAGSDRRFSSSEADITVTDANIDLKLTASDSGKFVTARFFKVEDGKEVVLAQEEVHLYIKRSFKPLPLMGKNDEGEDVAVNLTDDNGEITLPIPADIPGDDKGNIIIMARTESSDTYGNILAEQTAPWGLPVVVDNGEQKRALWASRANAPIWLITLSCSIILGVWLTIMYIVINLFRIKRIGKNPAVN